MLPLLRTSARSAFPTGHLLSLSGKRFIPSLAQQAVSEHLPQAWANATPSIGWLGRETAL